MEETEAKVLLASDYDDVVDFVSDMYVPLSILVPKDELSS
jgi:hypothetical protein